MKSPLINVYIYIYPKDTIIIECLVSLQFTICLVPKWFLWENSPLRVPKPSPRAQEHQLELEIRMLEEQPLGALWSLIGIGATWAPIAPVYVHICIYIYVLHMYFTHIYIYVKYICKTYIYISRPSSFLKIRGDHPGIQEFRLDLRVSGRNSGIPGWFFGLDLEFARINLAKKRLSVMVLPTVPG